MTILLLLASESVSIYFNGTLYIETKPLDITNQFTLSFRTCTGGTLLRQNGNGGYFELAVVPGTMDFSTDKFTESSLALRWRATGSRNITVLNVGSMLDQNRPYRVVFTPRTSGSQNATLLISLGNIMHLVNVSDTIYNIGPGENLTLGHWFTGCITFGDVFDVVNLTKRVGTSQDCPLDRGERCNRSGRLCVLSNVIAHGA